ncbi:MAG TPA: hypothetical protein VGM14_20905 [Streptosporangiaceae bacterium]|jgi:hypothetical protein
MITIPPAQSIWSRATLAVGAAVLICASLAAFSATGDPSLVVYVQLYANAETLAVARNEESGGQHVTGLGDDAFWTVAGNLFVQKGKRGFTITLPSLALTSRTAPPKIVTLAAAALARL